MIQKSKLIELFQKMWKEHWSYTWGGASKGNVDCSGAFVYAYKVLDGQKIAIHGSNYIARQECGEMFPISKAQPGMACFKKREKGSSKWALPARYQNGGVYYNGDLNDYYHIGLVDEDTNYVLNAQSTSTGFVRSPISQNWCSVAYLNKVTDEEDEGMDVLYQAKVKADTGSTVRMRSKPDATADVVEKVKIGETVDVYEDADGWAHIKHDDNVGYMMDKFLSKVDDEDEEDDDIDGTVTLTEAEAEEVLKKLAAIETIIRKNG